MTRHSSTLLLIVLVGCSKVGGADTGSSSITEEAFGDCPEPAPAGEALAWSALSGLGYLDHFEDSGAGLIEDAEAWAEAVPNLSPEDAGVDFDTQVAAVANWWTGGCEWPTQEVSAAVSDGASAYVEFTFDNSTTGNCEMAILTGMGVAVTKHEQVSVCLKTLTNY